MAQWLSGPSVMAAERSESALAIRPSLARPQTNDAGWRATDATGAARTIAEPDQLANLEQTDRKRRPSEPGHDRAAHSATTESERSATAGQPGRARLFAREPSSVQQHNLVRERRPSPRSLGAKPLFHRAAQRLSVSERLRIGIFNRRPNRPQHPRATKQSVRRLKRAGS